MFDSWGKWVRVMLTVVIILYALYNLPQAIDKLIDLGHRTGLIKP